MIPRVSKAGRSFKGIVLYMSHDQKAATSDRVGFVDFLNLPVLASPDKVRDMERAGAIMAWTAMHQSELKHLHHHQTSPAKPFRQPGRALAQPVYSFSLRFDEGDAPKVDEALLRKAAHGALKTLGMQNCQAIIVQHLDSHPSHVHVIACRVDPKTGQTVNTQRDFYKLSLFAQKFSREHGLRILSTREQNNELRRQGQAAKYHEVPRSEWERRRAYRGQTQYRVEQRRREQQEADRVQLAGRHRQEIQNFKSLVTGAYRRDRDRIDAEITRLRTKLGATGLFAAAVRLKRKLTREEQADKRLLTSLIKTRDNCDRRIAELRIPFARKLRGERIALANRHAAELERDRAYFESERQREGRETREIKRRALKAAQAKAARGEPSPGDGANASVAPVPTHDGPTRDTPAPGSQDSGPEREVREQLWNRRDGRNPDRPHRPRKPRSDSREHDPDHPRRRR